MSVPNIPRGFPGVTPGMIISVRCEDGFLTSHHRFSHKDTFLVVSVVVCTTDHGFKKHVLSGAKEHRTDYLYTVTNVLDCKDNTITQLVLYKVLDWFDVVCEIDGSIKDEV